MVHEVESSPMVPYSFTHGDKLYMIWRKTTGMTIEYLVDACSFTTIVVVEVPTQADILVLIPRETPTPKFTPMEIRFACNFPDGLNVWPFDIVRISKAFPDLNIDGLVLNINRSGVFSSRC